MRDELRWLGRAASQAASPLVVLLVAIELLRREQIVTVHVFAPWPLVALVLTWLVITVHRSLREAAG